jgi:hypothetical protein
MSELDKKMHPKDKEDWFNVEPLETIRHTHLIHPLVHLGVAGIHPMRSRSYDIRGDIPNPKMKVSPWTNIETEPKEIYNPL